MSSDLTVSGRATRLRLTGTAGLAIGTLICAGFPLLTEAETPQIETFVKGTYVHGLPVAEAEKFRGDPRATASLRHMLVEKDYTAYWSNIVITLGIIGHEEMDTEALLRFLKREAKSSTHGQAEATVPVVDRVDGVEARARIQVPIAIGYIIRRKSDQRLLGLLAEGLNPGVWKTDGHNKDEDIYSHILHWQREKDDEQDRHRNMRLAESCAHGLGVSRLDDAARKLHESLEDPALGDLREVLSSVCKQYFDSATCGPK